MKTTTKKTKKIKCAVCGKEFSPKAANSIYCSKECYKKGKAARERVRKQKSGKKPMLKEKIVIGKKSAVPAKKPVGKKVANKKENFDTIVSVKNGNPFKVFVLATLVRNRALAEIIKNRKIYCS